MYTQVWEECISKGKNRKVRTVRHPSKRIYHKKIEEVDSDVDKTSEHMKKHIYEQPKTRSQTKMNTICRQRPVVKKKAWQTLGRTYR